MHEGKLGKEKSKETFIIIDNIIGSKKESGMMWFGTSGTWAKGQDGEVI